MLHRLIRDIPKKGDLNETKKERMPRTTVYGSHFAEYRKLCNGIAVIRTRTTFFVGQISNLLRYHYSTIPYPPYKTTLKTSSQLGQLSYLSYFRGSSKITDYYSSRSVVLSLWKSFLQNFASRLRILFGGKYYLVYCLNFYWQPHFRIEVQRVFIFFNIICAKI